MDVINLSINITTLSRYKLIENTAEKDEWSIYFIFIIITVAIAQIFVFKLRRVN